MQWFFCPLTDIISNKKWEIIKTTDIKHANVGNREQANQVSTLNKLNYQLLIRQVLFADDNSVLIVTF